MNFIKILAGDRVLVELSPYDLTREELFTVINKKPRTGPPCSPEDRGGNEKSDRGESQTVSKENL